MRYLLFALTLIAGISAGSVSHAAPGSNNGEHNGAAHTNCGKIPPLAKAMGTERALVRVPLCQGGSCRPDFLVRF